VCETLAISIPPQRYGGDPAFAGEVQLPPRTASCPSMITQKHTRPTVLSFSYTLPAGGSR
jgi:hypothetical protein